jgi:hypothetical protein
MTQAPISYDLLLKLYHGSASVVELLDAAALSALRVEIPLLTALSKISQEAHPRHVFLTGNAGDGKTFTSRCVFDERAPGVCVIQDATQVHADSGPPIEALAARLCGALERGERLFVSINRGQLERLRAHLDEREEGARRELRAHLDEREEGARRELRALVVAAVDALRLRPSWEEGARGDLLVVDLGLMDVIAEEILSPVIEKLISATPSPGMSPGSLAAFSMAKAALATPSIQAELKSALAAARADGDHATMRQLWALMAWLLTGARAADDPTPAGLQDTFAARLFEGGEGPLFDRARREDPATTPWPGLTRRALVDPRGLRAALSALPGVGALALADEGALDGRLVARVATIHGLRDERQPPRAAPAPLFERLVDVLKGGRGGAQAHARRLFVGIYRALGFWTEGEVFPAWERLCYDLSRFERATLVAGGQFDAERLRFELPRPHPDAASALGGWRPPYLWLRYEGHEEHLRLSPRLMRALMDAADGRLGQVTPADAEALWRWLARIGTVSGRRDALRLYAPGAASPHSIAFDDLEGRVTLS